MAAGFDKLGWMDACLRNAHDLTHAELRVMLVLFSYASSKDGGSIRPGLQRLIKESCVGKKKVLESLRELQELGYIVLVEKGGNEVRKGWATTYRLGFPNRIYAEEGSTRGPLTTPLHDPQGESSDPEGVPSRHLRGVLTTPQEVSSGDHHPGIDPGIHPGIESFTTEADASADPKNPGGLSKEQRTEIINAMLEVVRVQLDPFQDYDTLQAADDEYVDILVKHLGYDYEHLLVNLGYSNVPDYIHGDRYAAGQRLNVIINAGQAEGYTVEGAA